MGLNSVTKAKPSAQCSWEVSLWLSHGGISDLAKTYSSQPHVCGGRHRQDIGALQPSPALESCWDDTTASTLTPVTLLADCESWTSAVFGRCSDWQWVPDDSIHSRCAGWQWASGHQLSVAGMLADSEPQDIICSWQVFWACFLLPGHLLQVLQDQSPVSSSYILPPASLAIQQTRPVSTKQS